MEQIIRGTETFKNVDKKIDLFLDRAETLVQNFVQTTVTTSIKMVTSPFPGISFVGALITTSINWVIIWFKTALRTYDLYTIYSEIQDEVVKNGGVRSDASAKIAKLREEAVKKVVNNSSQVRGLVDQVNTAKDIGQNVIADANKLTSATKQSN